MRSWFLIAIILLNATKPIRPQCVAYTCPTPECDLDSFSEQECRQCYDSLNDRDARKMKYGEDGLCWIRMRWDSDCRCGARTKEMFKGCKGYHGDKFYVLRQRCWARFKGVDKRRSVTYSNHTVSA